MLDPTHDSQAHPHARGLRRRTLLAVAGLAAGAAPLTWAADAAKSGPVKVETIAIVTPETEADHGWNMQGLIGARDVAKAMGLKLNVYDNVGYNDVQTILKQVAGAGNDLVIAHASGFTTAAVRVAQETGVPMLAVYDGDSKILGPRLGLTAVEGEQAGYLGGVAAAAATKTGKVGLVLSAEDLNWYELSGGFIQGARATKRDIKIFLSYVGPAGYSDSAGAKRVAQQLIALGADVIMGMGNGATVGYIAAVEEARGKVRYIATVGNVDDLVKHPDVVLTAVTWNFQHVFRQAVEDLRAGTYGQKMYYLNLADKGFSVLDTPQLTGPVKAAVDAAQKALLAGTLQVKQITDKRALQEMLDL